MLPLAARTATPYLSLMRLLDQITGPALFALALCLAPGIALGQGYANLAPERADGYARVSRDTPIIFPQDHAAHPRFRNEWWYVTANLTGDDGADYGAQWTLFRTALRPGEDPGDWSSTQLWFAHAALTGANFHAHAEKFARGGVGAAGVRAADGLDAWIDDWSLTGPTPAQLTMRAGGAEFAYSLELATSRPFVRQGDNGFSLKTPTGQASHYYAQPFFEVTGHIEHEGRRIAVTGRAWMDREWSSQILTEAQEGWDWFAFHLDEATKLMIGRMRNTDGTSFVLGNWATQDGRSQEIPGDEVTLEPTRWTAIDDREVPTSWRLSIPSRGVAVETEPLNPRAWMGTAFAYWEGPIRFTGSHKGVGYLEMTGY
ncbi:MAG: lipocalin-like domain-containing protein [Pseudomonadota bacterium]